MTKFQVSKEDKLKVFKEDSLILYDNPESVKWNPGIKSILNKSAKGIN